MCGKELKDLVSQCHVYIGKYPTFLCMILFAVFQEHDQSLFERVTHSMIELLTLRGLLVDKDLSQEEASDLKRDIVSVIDWGNGYLSYLLSVCSTR